MRQTLPYNNQGIYSVKQAAERKVHWKTKTKDSPQSRTTQQLIKSDQVILEL